MIKVQKIFTMGLTQKRLEKKIPDQLIKTALRKFYFLDNAIILADLNSLPGNKLELLHGDRKGQYSIRINQQYRICFIWTFQGPKRVEIVDYH